MAAGANVVVVSSWRSRVDAALARLGERSDGGDTSPVLGALLAEVQAATVRTGK